ncbi:MAG: cysteine dioxygenase family protein [Planctomycetota bacterium]
MVVSSFESAFQLVKGLDESVRCKDVKAITRNVQATLTDIVQSGDLRLAGRFRAVPPTGYARRLLHRNPELRYTALVMTWPPSHATPLHDHAGMWCVEVVVQGLMHVRRFELQEQASNLYRFAEVENITAGVGSAGSLIPPTDYHILGNCLADRVSITLHVYGGEMKRCHVYEPRGDDWYERIARELEYTD